MRCFSGIPASTGIAEGPCYAYQEESLAISEQVITDPAAEMGRLAQALERAKSQLAQIEAQAAAASGADQAQIFRAQALILADPALLNSVRKSIQASQHSAEAAWAASTEQYAGKLAAMPDEYFRARAADVRDVGRRVLRLLLGLEDVALAALARPSIIVARDLTPSDTVRLDKALVLGFCTAEGGATSHSAILAKSLGIPAVVGLGQAILDLGTGVLLLIDGERGVVIAEPDDQTLEEMRDRSGQAAAEAREQAAQVRSPAITSDGRQVEVLANIGSLEEARIALDRGAEGVGLLRTEFLFLDRATPPGEGEQLAAYRAVLDSLGTRPVIVRTLDVGGDKPPPYLDLGQEANPFLGWRAIRICLDRPAFFKDQLRALLRASPGHDLRIMFPMIAALEELRQAKELLAEAAQETRLAQQPIADRIDVGMMVEIPSAAVMADLFACEVDFFSIGTNDLTQYTLAAERTNPKVAHLGDACHPAVLRLIQQVVEAAHQHEIPAGVCGELGGDPEAIPILLGLGLDELSMAPSSIPRAKAIIRAWSVARARALAEAALRLATAQDVRRLVREQAAWIRQPPR